MGETEVKIADYQPVAIIQLWNWGWTYIGLQINNCGKGIDITANGTDGIATGSITVIDSTFKDTPVGIATAWQTGAKPDTAGSVIIENLALQNVPVAIQGPSGTVLEGGSTTIAGWGQGHQYSPDGPTTFAGNIDGNNRPNALLGDNGYYSRSKPQYADLAASDFVSARDSGAKGDATTDDVSFFSYLDTIEGC